MIGYDEQRFELTARKETTLDVALIEKSSSIDDVVVTGYQQLSKERVTGSFGKLPRRSLTEP